LLNSVAAVDVVLIRPLLRQNRYGRLCFVRHCRKYAFTILPFLILYIPLKYDSAGNFLKPQE